MFINAKAPKRRNHFVNKHNDVCARWVVSLQGKLVERNSRYQASDFPAAQIRRERRTQRKLGPSYTGYFADGWIVLNEILRTRRYLSSCWLSQLGRFARRLAPRGRTRATSTSSERLRTWGTRWSPIRKPLRRCVCTLRIIIALSCLQYSPQGWTKSNSIRIRKDLKRVEFLCTCHTMYGLIGDLWYCAHL